MLLILNLLIVISLISLYIYSTKVEPLEIDISYAKKYIGDYVEVRGIVWKVSKGEDYTFITLTENFKNSLRIIADFRIPLSPGMKLEARGLLIKQSSGIALQVKHKSELKILSSEFRTTIPVLLENPSSFENFLVSFSGKIKYEKITYLNLSDSTGYIHAFVSSGYEGERKAYFYGYVKNGNFRINAAYSNFSEDCKVENISDVKELKNGKACVYARIYSYGFYLIVKEQNYSIRVYGESPEIPHGSVNIEGTFHYNSHIGEYVVYARNIK